jgi:hypothetical protein
MQEELQESGSFQEKHYLLKRNSGLIHIFLKKDVIDLHRICMQQYLEIVLENVQIIKDNVIKRNKSKFLKTKISELQSCQS